MSLSIFSLIFTSLPAYVSWAYTVYGEKKLLTNNAWEQFQEMFTENGFKIYESRGLVEVNISEKIKAEREAENQRLTVNELLERTRNAY